MSAGAVNVAFEEPSFRRPSLPHQTRGTDANGNSRTRLSVRICHRRPRFSPRALITRA